jgi:hypothetical protein
VAPSAEKTPSLFVPEAVCETGVMC